MSEYNLETLGDAPTSRPPTLIMPSDKKLDLPLLSATTLHRGGDWIDVIAALCIVGLCTVGLSLALAFIWAH